MVVFSAVAVSDATDAEIATVTMTTTGITVKNVLAVVMKVKMNALEENAIASNAQMNNLKISVGAISARKNTTVATKITTGITATATILGITTGHVAKTTFLAQ